MVTAELATALPVLVLLMMTGVAAVQVADARVRCLDAAREVARASARDDPGAVALGRQVVSGAAQISVARGDSSVTATVRLTVHPLGIGFASFTIIERATAAREKPVGGPVP